MTIIKIIPHQHVLVPDDLQLICLEQCGPVGGSLTLLGTRGALTMTVPRLVNLPPGGRTPFCKDTKPAIQDKQRHMLVYKYSVTAV